MSQAITLTTEAKAEALTAIKVSALAAPVLEGEEISFVEGGTTVRFVASAEAAKSATEIKVISTTPGVAVKTSNTTGITKVLTPDELRYAKETGTANCCPICGYAHKTSSTRSTPTPFVGL
jgi:hypothetical protein